MLKISELFLLVLRNNFLGVFFFFKNFEYSKSKLIFVFAKGYFNLGIKI
ncbi:hypothetical protein BH23BAC1_BH23BAC1_18070 [soil metagenome]